VANHVFVCYHVVVPEGSLSDVVSRELPVLLRVLKALKKTLLLLFLGDVEEKLTNDDAITGQIALEIPDILETFFPDVLGDELGRQLLLFEKFPMDTHHKYFLVVAAIEDAYVSAFRHAPYTAPQKIEIEVVRRRGFEGIYLTALWINPRHHVLDSAVLACSVNGLKDKQHRPAVLRIQLVL
jgi:hypothetical protein